MKGLQKNCEVIWQCKNQILKWAVSFLKLSTLPYFVTTANVPYSFLLFSFQLSTCHCG